MNRRAALSTLVALATLASACSGDDNSTSDPPEPPPTTPATTTDDAGSRSTNGDSGLDGPDQPGTDVEVTELGVDLLTGAGTETVVNDIHLAAGGRWAVGHRQRLQDRDYQPFIMFSRGGEASGRWEPEPVQLPRGVDAATMSTMVEFDGRLIVLGTQWTDGRAQGVAWQRSPQATWEPRELVGDIAAGPSVVIRTGTAAMLGHDPQRPRRRPGRPTVVAIGTSQGRQALWTSTDGTSWSEIDVAGDLGLDDLDFVELAANRHGIVALATADGRAMLLSSTDGAAFELLQTSTSPQRWNTLVADDDWFFVGGAVHRGRQYHPRLWRLRGLQWPAGEAEGATNHPRRYYAWGDDAQIDTMTLQQFDEGTRLLFMVGDVLIDSAGPGNWEQRGLPETPPNGDLTALAPVPGVQSEYAQVVVDGSQMLTIDDDEWSDSTPDALSPPMQRVELVDVAHNDGTWVAAATTTNTLGETATEIWVSDDGQEWTSAQRLRPRGTQTIALGAANQGFAAVAQHPGREAAVVWWSPDGRTWNRIVDPALRWPRRGILVPHAVTSIPDGFAIGGAVIGPRAVRPWLIRVRDGDVHRDASQHLHGPEDSALLGICRPEGNLHLVGVQADPGASPAWWSQSGSAPWRRLTLDRRGELRACAARGWEVWGLGTVGQRQAVLDLGGGGDPRVHPLPHSDAAIATGVVPIGGDRLVVSGHTTGHDRNGRLWISGPADPGTWRTVDTPELGGPGDQEIAGTAAVGNQVLVGINDGAGARLVTVTLPQ